ncbi:SMI1/KNR4 family protein [Polyangium sp. 6x1]|uniref:SMI1/KNR4 family protein n=1 Tax=Polyangium sp. 6x1 TaxID=3042689 RepID=UPI002482118C|nr:SMI1/KNR4 family protein [Polyangium sp. 6x1]MDI1450214.1 SMI1/KNR4 family protein [Polyangium sp. 6x1]
MASLKDSDRPQRAAAATRRVAAWLQKHAPEAAAELSPPADPAAVEALAKALRKPLPAELVAMWAVHDGLPIFEYAGLGAAAAKKRRAGLETLRKKGTFADHEVFEQNVPRIKPVKWHAAWIPIAQDGCGNFYCIDLAPGPAGRVGQVIKWEVAGGPFASGSSDLATVLERYADALESGDHTYLVDSGTYDGPYLDLLADP